MQAQVLWQEQRAHTEGKCPGGWRWGTTYRAHRNVGYPVLPSPGKATACYRPARTTKWFRFLLLHRSPGGLAPVTHGHTQVSPGWPWTSTSSQHTIPADKERSEPSQIHFCKRECGCKACFQKGHISHILSGFHTFLSKCMTALCEYNKFQKGKNSGYI